MDDRIQKKGIDRIVQAHRTEGKRAGRGHLRDRDFGRHQHGRFPVSDGVLELIPCIAIGLGGVVTSWLSSWVLYCIGDTHVKIERLENKLIPKPAYAEYLAGNVPERGACEICGRTTDLIAAKIEDSMGVRYRKVCRDCFAANNATEAN